jgi:hypothetical protein
LKRVLLRARAVYRSLGIPHLKEYTIAFCNPPMCIEVFDFC